MKLTVRYGGKQGKSYELQPSKDVIVVRSENRYLPVHIPLSPKARGTLNALTPIMEVRSAGVQLFAAPSRTATSSIQRTRELLNKEDEVQFAGAALRDPQSGGR